MTSLSYPVAEACSRIANENRKIAHEIDKFVVPHDSSLKSGYFRFEGPTKSSFFEHSEFQSLVTFIRDWSQSATGSTLTAQAASLLESDSFPTALEDYIALAALASLLKHLVTFGYMKEAELIADAISNFILYEGGAAGHGSFLKTRTATRFEGLANTFRTFGKAYEHMDPRMQTDNRSSAAQALNGLMTWPNRLPTEDKPPQDLQTPSDFAAGAYFFLTLVESGDYDSFQHPDYQPLFRQLAFAVGSDLEVSTVFISRVQALLELSNLAATCEAGTVELLRGCKRLLYNGAVIRHLHKVLSTTPLDNVAEFILSPIANALALSIRMDNWTPLRDDSIANLLRSEAVSSNNPWSFVNLAIERIRVRGSLEPQGTSSTMAVAACEKVLSMNSRLFEARKPTLAVLSVRNGYFGLLEKCLNLENLTDPLSTAGSNPSPGSLEAFNRSLGSDENNLFHLSSRLGYTKVCKLVIECIGMTSAKTVVNSSNARGQTPLHLACMHRAPRGIFTLLWILGADRDARCNLGRTPLHYCFPEQQLLPSVWRVVLETLEDYALPTIVPAELPKAYGPYGKGNSIDSRTSDFRIIVRDLVLRKADMTTVDNDGMTPLHLAAREGWGENLDIFLVQTGPTFSRPQEICLQLRDAAGFTVLDHARKTGVQGALNGGENVVVAEMRKREMDTSLQRRVSPTTPVRNEPSPNSFNKPSPVQSSETSPADNMLPPGVALKQYTVPTRSPQSQHSSPQYVSSQTTSQNMSGNVAKSPTVVPPMTNVSTPSNTISTYTGSSPPPSSHRVAYSPPNTAQVYPKAGASLSNQTTVIRKPVQQAQPPPAQLNPSRSTSNHAVPPSWTNEDPKEKKQSSNLFKRMLR